MFSAAVMVGSRLNDWKMKPIRSRRSSVSALSLSEVISVSPRYTSPEVGRSRPASMCSSVDLPEPEGPMIAVNWPCAEPDADVVERGDGGVAAAVELADALGPGRGTAVEVVGRRVLVVTDMWFS